MLFDVSTMNTRSIFRGHPGHETFVNVIISLLIHRLTNTTHQGKGGIERLGGGGGGGAGGGEKREIMYLIATLSPPE